LAYIVIGWPSLSVASASWYIISDGESTMISWSGMFPLDNVGAWFITVTLIWKLTIFSVLKSCPWIVETPASLLVEGISL
jgi:hypothetical protein